MADLKTTQLKLRTTPTAGVSGEHSPYARRLSSAGYKGFLQGTIGGGSLYGLIGLSVGAIISIPIAIFTGGTGALLTIPILTGLGIIGGGGTFGVISAVSAITAESAEMSESRRYLLDRYNDLPDVPEYDSEAEQIKRMLARQHTSEKPESMFHPKTVLIGATIGAAVVLGYLALNVAGVPLHSGIDSALVEVAKATGIEVAPGVAAEALHSALSAGGAWILSAIGAAMGALAGATIGLDRYYIRRWFDFAEGAVQDQTHTKAQIAAREREVDDLGKNSPSDYAERDNAKSAAKINVVEHAQPLAPALAEGDRPTREAPITPEVIAGLKPPSATASSIEHLDRIQSAMRNPTV